MKRTSLILLIAGLAAASAGGVYWYSNYAEKARAVEAVKASIPARPSLSRWPSELAARIANAERAAQAGEEPIDALATLAQLYHANGFEEEAVVAYKGLVTAEPANPKWSHLLANILSTYGRSEQAVSLWERVVEQAPDFVPARIKLGDALLKMDRVDDAARIYDAGLRVAPQDAYLLVGRARVAIQRRDWAEARTLLEAATQNSQFRIGNDLLVTAYEALGEQEKALAIRAKAKSFGTFFDPPDVWADAVYEDCYDPYRLAMGSGLADRRGEMDTAVRLLERAIRIDPSYAIAYFHLGKLEQRRNRLPEAERNFRKSIELDPSYGDSWLVLYEQLKRQNNAMGAAAVLREGLQRCPDSPGLHFEQGRIHVAAGRLDEALAEFALVMKLRPAEVEAVIETAKIHFAQNRIDEGLSEMQRVLDILPGHPIALFTLAFFWIENGEQEQARYWLHECRNQPRLSRDDVANLAQRYQQRFGRSPW